MSEYSGYVQKLKEEGTLNYFYVYAYLRKDGTPYYIGKGQGYRIHDKYGHYALPPRERRVKIKENLFEDEALQLEEELILKYGRKKYDEGGILYNASIGGSNNRIWRTLEEKKKSKSESDRKYREKNIEQLSLKSKEYYEKNREEILAKEKAKRATPEGKVKKAVSNKKYQEEVIKKDPIKLKAQRKRQREHAYKKAREEGKPTIEEIGRKFKVVSPDGKVYEGIKCKPFAEEHNLDPACFTSMVRGDITHHNGWVVYGFKPPEGKKQKSNGGYFPTRVKNIKQYSFKMIDPQGNIHEGFNQREFAEQHKLNVKYLNRVLTGQRMTCHGGWKRA